MRPTLKRVKRVQKAVPRNPTDHPVEQSWIWVGDEPTRELSSARTSQLGLRGSVQQDKARGWAVFR
jgi:hypothetical protein